MPVDWADGGNEADGKKAEEYANKIGNKGRRVHIFVSQILKWLSPVQIANVRILQEGAQWPHERKEDFESKVEPVCRAWVLREVPEWTSLCFGSKK